MKVLRKLSVLIPAALLSVEISAATMVEMKDHQGLSQRFYIGDQMARWDMDQGKGYMLIEMNGTRVYTVDTESRVIAEINTNEIAGAPAAPKGNGSLKREGNGPDIAGYDTDKYALMAGNTKCGEVYLSREALDVKGMRRMWDVMEEMATRASAMAHQFAPPSQDPCDTADTTIMAKMSELGMPMKSFDKQGKLESEIVQIAEGQKTAPDFFSLPEGYQRFDMNEQMRMIQQMQSQMPSPEQMQNMSPEEREQFMRQLMNR